MAEEIRKRQLEELKKKLSHIRYKHAKIFKLGVLDTELRWRGRNVDIELISLESLYRSVEDEARRLKDPNYKKAIKHLKEAKKDKKTGFIDMRTIDYGRKWKHLQETIKYMEVFIFNTDETFQLGIPLLEEKCNELERVEGILKGEYQVPPPSPPPKRFITIPESTFDITLIGTALNDLSSYLQNIVLNTRDIKRLTARLRDYLHDSDADKTFKDNVKFFVDEIVGNYKEPILNETQRSQTQNFHDMIKKWYDERVKK